MMWKASKDAIAKKFNESGLGTIRQKKLRTTLQIVFEV